MNNQNESDDVIISILNELRLISTLLMKISSDTHIIKKKLLLNIEPDEDQMEFVKMDFQDDVFFQNQEVVKFLQSMLPWKIS